MNISISRFPDGSPRLACWLGLLLAATRGLTFDIGGWQSFGSGGSVGQAGGFHIQGSFGPMATGFHSSGKHAISGGFLTVLNTNLETDPPPAGAPTISYIGPQVVNEDEQTSFIPFQIRDSNTPVGALIINRDSSDPAVVPLSGIILDGISSNRTVRIRAAANASGPVLITLSVSDGVHTTRESFVVNVRPVNDPPTLTRIVNAVVNEDSATDELQFLVGDLETPPGELTVSASVADPSLVPPSGIAFGGTGANRWLRLTPAGNHFGGTTITYRVTDGNRTTEQTFPLMVISNNDAPSVTSIADASVASGEFATVEFTIADVDHSLAELSVTVQSDNTALINNTGLKRTDLGGGKHSLLLTPLAGRTGIAVITILAADPRGAPGRSQFKLTVTPAVPQLDFGDAPQTYPVLLSANGARHTIKPGYFLGSGVDAESDGQPNPTATGDDTSSPDDEDGVRFSVNTAGQSILYNGHAGLGANFSSNTIIVTASAAGKLDAWLDFNRDGDWNDAGEQIFKTRALVAGSNTLSIVVSNTAAAGATFARFRLSSAGNLPPDGAATDGEVEDYGVLVAPAQVNSRNLFGGLRFASIGDAKVEVDSKGILIISNLTAQGTRGISFEPGHAMGVEGEISRQLGTSMSNSISLRFRGSQGGQAKDVAHAKWEGPVFDQGKNEVSIETLEIASAGLVYKEANVRLFNSRGEQIHLDKYGAGGFTGAFTISSPYAPQLADTGTHEVGHWIGVVADTQRFEDSPVGGGMHFVASWPASGGRAGHRVTMPDGKSVNGVAFGIFSYEGLPQAVDYLERVEVLGSGVGSSLELSRMGLLHDGFRFTGAGNTRISGNYKAGVNNLTQPFFFLPETDDEVLVSFSEAHMASRQLGRRPCCFVSPARSLFPPQFAIPEALAGGAGSRFRMSAIQKDRRANGAERSFHAEVSLPPATSQSLNPMKIKLSYVGENTANVQFRITGSGAGGRVETIILDGKGIDVNVEEVELSVSGSVRLVGIQPAFLERGQSIPTHRLVFDVPVTVAVAGKSFEARELSFSVPMWAHPEVLEFIAKLELPVIDGLGQTEIRLPADYDWGDLPFETTQAQNGPSHLLSYSNLRLGEHVDNESDGRSSLDAAGDDVDLSPDDEDGLAFAAIAVPGTDCRVDVHVTGAPMGAYIDAFVDWNFNGAFDVASGEKVIDRLRVWDGINLLTIPVPTTATPGQKYIRFRLSTAGGLGSGGPAVDGEVEDHVIRVEGNAFARHSSGLIPVPKGVATLRSTPGGGMEISELAGSAMAGLSLLAPSNVVSQSAGRILLPLNPPIPVPSFDLGSHPFADGLVLEAHYTVKNRQRRAPSLRFRSVCTTGPCDRLQVSVGGCAGRSDEMLQVLAFVDGRSIGSFSIPCGELGVFQGNAKITQLGWVASPVSAMVFFDQDVAFTSAEGRSMSARQFRINHLLDENEAGGNVVFEGVDVFGPILAVNGTAGFSNLKVINPQVPSIRDLRLVPGGIVRMEFNAEESVFYRLEETTLGPLGWSPADWFSEIMGAGSTRTLTMPSDGNVPPARFFRLRAE